MNAAIANRARLVAVLRVLRDRGQPLPSMGDLARAAGLMGASQARMLVASMERAGEVRLGGDRAGRRMVEHVTDATPALPSRLRRLDEAECGRLLEMRRQGSSLAQIARAMGISQPTARKHLAALSSPDAGLAAEEEDVAPDPGLWPAGATFEDVRGDGEAYAYARISPAPDRSLTGCSAATAAGAA